MKKMMFAVIAGALTMAAAAARDLAPATGRPADQEPPDGGMVMLNAEGKLAVVNACAYEGSVISNTVKKIGNVFMILVEEQKSGCWSLADAAGAFAATGANAAIFVVKDRSLPISLVAMEARWGVVNAEGMDDAVLGREIMRVTTLLLGGASSKYSASVMRPAFSVEDLAKVGDLATIDSLMAIFPNLKAYGFKQFEMMSFREAYENGYTPAPQNEVQKQIAAEFKK